MRHTVFMIATIAGKVTEKNGLRVVIEVNGIGYEINLPTADIEHLILGAQAKLFIYEHLREDIHALYGFLEAETKALFEHLISVSGIGPKVGLAILSAISREQLIKAINSGQSSLLQAVPGVGKKMADRIILELHNRLGGGDTVGNLTTNQEDSVFAALRQLGYSTSQAYKAIAALPSDLTDDQERIKQALKTIS